MQPLSFTTDRNLFIRTWEAGIADYTGKQCSGDVLGKKYHEILPRIFFKEQDALEIAVQRKEPVRLEAYRFTCLHAHIMSDVAIIPVLSATGTVESVRVSLRPVSNCPLARELDRSQKLIDIGKIASTLAHGVRNPLNAIKGAVVYLREKYANERPLTEFTEIMEDEISRLESYISQFLSSSVSSTELCSTDINSLLKKIDLFTSLQMYAHRIRATYELGNVLPVLTNPFHVEQAVLNVINNAVEAMQSGGELTVRTRTEDAPGDRYTVIEISDTGPGMRPAVTDTSAKDRQKNGKGFGLLLTREILEFYGGRMEIDGARNRGTSVRLYLPLKHEV